MAIIFGFWHKMEHNLPLFQLDLYGLFAGAGSLDFYGGHFNVEENLGLGIEIGEGSREQASRKTQFWDMFINFASPLIKFIKLIKLY